MENLDKLLDLSWLDGIGLVIVLMSAYTYKVWIDSKFKK